MKDSKVVIDGLKIEEEKIKMAIWFFNNLIDRYPLVYQNLKRIYEREVIETVKR